MKRCAVCGVWLADALFVNGSDGCPACTTTTPVVQRGRPRRVLLTFGGAAYDEITEQVVRDAPGFGVDEVRVYDDAWLDAHPFRELNAWLWEPTKHAAPGRGYGWYSWKPVVILDALERCEPGDVVLYIDADTRPIADLGVVYETAAREGAMLFAASAHDNHRWCTRDAEIVLGLNPDHLARKGRPGAPDLMHRKAGCARFMAFAKGPWKPRQLLMEWLTYCVNPMATTFEPSTLGADDPDFQEHRTEQAILTLLAHKYGFPLYREADQDGVEFMGQQPGDYPQLFEQKHLGGPHPRGAGSRFRNVDGWR